MAAQASARYLCGYLRPKFHVCSGPNGIPWRRSFLSNACIARYTHGVPDKEESYAVYTAKRMFSALSLSPSKNANYVESASLLRNVGIFAHIDAGKTTISEGMLFDSNEIASRGFVHQGNTHMDFLPQERQHGITIKSAATTFYWNKHHINLIDTPGHVDFTEEVNRAVSALDAAVIVLDATRGVEAQTTTVWKQIHSNQKLPRIVFINKLDREREALEPCVAIFRRRLHPHPLKLQFYAEKATIVDLLHRRICCYDGSRRSSSYDFDDVQALAMQAISLPFNASLLDWKSIKDEENSLLEQLADLDDEFAEIFLSSEQISLEAKISALKRITLESTGIPIFCGSAMKNEGIDLLLDGIIELLPSPVERSSHELLPSSTRSSERFSQCLQNVASRGKVNFREVSSSHQAYLSDTHTEGAMKINCRKNDVFYGIIFKVIPDKRGGSLAYLRVISGMVIQGMKVFNASQGEPDKIESVYRVNADRFTNLKTLLAGDIGMVRGLRHAKNGDTLHSLHALTRHPTQQSFTLRVGRSRPASPVCFVSIEAENVRDESALTEALEDLCLEDSSLHTTTEAETAQKVLWGLGELHMQIVKERLLSDYGLAVVMGDMDVAYKEYINETLEGSMHHQMAPINRAMFSAPSASSPSEFQTVGMSLRLEPAKLPDVSDSLRENHAKFDEVDLNEEENDVYMQEEYQCKVIFSKSIAETYSPSNDTEEPRKKNRDSSFSGRFKEASGQSTAFDSSKLPLILSSIEQTLLHACSNGPRLSLPILGLKIFVDDLKLYANTNDSVVRACSSLLFRKIISGASSHLMEPFIFLDITCSESSVGKLSQDLTHKRRAHISRIAALDKSSNDKTNSDEATMSLMAVAPLKAMNGYSSVLRSISHGTATCQMHPWGYGPAE